MKLLLLLMFACGVCRAQTDIFLMPGSDLDRPGVHPRANLNIGVGHTFAFSKANPLGEELTLAYTYENAGTHGFWHTAHGAHTEALGMMKNMTLSPKMSLYSWAQAGVTSFTSGRAVQNRMYSGAAVGLAHHFTGRHGVWLQETYNKVNTVPWYTTTGIGYVFSF